MAAFGECHYSLGSLFFNGFYECYYYYYYYFDLLRKKIKLIVNEQQIVVILLYAKGNEDCK